MGYPYAQRKSSKKTTAAAIIAFLWGSSSSFGLFGIGYALLL